MSINCKPLTSSCILSTDLKKAYKNTDVTNALFWKKESLNIFRLFYGSILEQHAKCARVDAENDIYKMVHSDKRLVSRGIFAFKQRILSKGWVRIHPDAFTNMVKTAFLFFWACEGV